MIRFSGNAKITLCTIIFLIFYGVAYIIWGEHIKEGDGLGFDGVDYGNITMHFEEMLSGQTTVLSFRAQRIFPSVVAYIFFKTIGIQPKSGQVVNFFEWYNLFLLLLAANTWGSLANFFRLDSKRQLLGSLGLFCNHAVLKYNMYYPVLTDTTAFCISLLMLWAFFLRKPYFLLFLIFLGSFTFPTLPLIGSIFLIFPYKETNTRQLNHHYKIIFPTLLMIAFIFVFCLHVSLYFSSYLSPVFILSLFIIFSYWSYSAYYVFDSLCFFNLKCIIKSINFINVFICIMIFIVTNFIISMITPKWAPASSGSLQLNANTASMANDYFYSVIFDATKRPCEFFIAHCLYYGPLLLMASCFYRQILYICQEFGYGFIFAFVLVLFHSIMPISRQLIAEYPIFVLSTILVVNKVPISPKFMILFTFLSLILSKFWMLFNLVPASPPSKGWVQGFSFENYVSSTGWWMSDSYFIGQGATIIFIAILFYFYFNFCQRHTLPQ